MVILVALVVVEQALVFKLLELLLEALEHQVKVLMAAAALEQEIVPLASLAVVAVVVQMPQVVMEDYP
jgi:hypothetical protein